MILVDTSIWIGHLREADPGLSSLLEQGEVLCHPWVIGELALGNLRNRAEVLSLLHGLPCAEIAGDDEVAQLVEDECLAGSGLGYVDAQLLAATRLTPEARLWTADRQLAAVAARLGINARSA